MVVFPVPPFPLATAIFTGLFLVLPVLAHLSRVLLRPVLFVLAPLLFSGMAFELNAILSALAAFVLFCLLASAVYIGNDALDREADRAHPTKRLRPIAAGRIGLREAALVGSVMLLLAVAGSFLVSPTLGAAACAYVVLNVLYTVRLKRIVIVDVFTIAAFFLLRLLAGAGAIGVSPSVWLLLCGGLLALYLGFTKRRHELVLLGSDSVRSRSVLSHYSAVLLDQISVVLLSATVISYVMYTLESQTAAVFGSEALSYSTVFVLYGVFRYLYLVHQHDGGSPTETLLTDPPLLVNVGLWLLYCGWVIYKPV